MGKTQWEKPLMPTYVSLTHDESILFCSDYVLSFKNIFNIAPRLKSNNMNTVNHAVKFQAKYYYVLVRAWA